MLGRILVLILLMLALAPAAEAADSLVPQAGVLVLRNGQIMEGEITRAGDYFVVTLGTTGEVRLPAADVEGHFRSLDEAYLHKRDALPDRGADPHLDLAEWCLRHNLKRRCAEQLIAAMQTEPAHPRIEQLEKRLEVSNQAPPATSIKTPTTSATVSAEQLDATLGALPKGSVEKFSAVIQPLLLNRCGANQCHGPNAKAELRLLKPPAGQVATKRFTQRNLYAVLKQIDQSQPEVSPLLVMPQRRHGTALTAVFDKHTQKQLDELTAWVKATFVSEPAPVPVTIRPSPGATLSQPAPAAPAEPGASPAPAPAGPVHAMSPDTSDPKGKGRSGTVFVPRDPYDPEHFNRRFAEK